MMFLRTILIMEDDMVCKRILQMRTHDYMNDTHKSNVNERDKPIFDILNIGKRIGMYDICIRMILGDLYFSKEEWRNIVWRHVWSLEDEECLLLYRQPHQNILLLEIMDGPYYLVWWVIVDIIPKYMGMCERMASLACNTSLLKATDYRLKGKTVGYKMCDLCDLGITEDIRHVVMQCPFFEPHRKRMYDDVRQTGPEGVEMILGRPQEIFYVLMGKQPNDIAFDMMVHFWIITGTHIVKMYDEIISGRHT